MSHDTDKLIRQLSLVAFLMAERRALTARDVKSNVEGYSEMSDEAFARRFYSDRAELIALGVPLQSQRDEFTGEELYTLRSENYFLDQLQLEEDELAALQTALFLLDGKFAYAEPLRLALQNLVLGRPGFAGGPTATAKRVRVTDRDYTPELAGRISKLEAAIAKQRTVKFSYWSPQRDAVDERTLNPYALRLDEGVWYVVGHDLDREEERTFRVSRIRSDIRFATRRERDFKVPPEFDVERHRVGQPWQVGPRAGIARIEVAGDTAWWVRRTLSDAGRLDDGVFETEYASVDALAGWVLRQTGRATALAPPELRTAVLDALERVRAAHEGPPPRLAAERLPDAAAATAERPAAPLAPERFAVLQALLAHLLAACGDGRNADLDAAELAESFSIPLGELQEHLSLLNLVNFGGGCYTVYAEYDAETGLVHVDKELYGDVFRRAPKLTPLEARAIRLALEYVGPTIAADARTPLERVRRKLEETFGQFELAQTPEPHVDETEEELVRTLSEGIRRRRVVELEYQKEGDVEWTTRRVEPHELERRLPHWYVHTWDRDRDAARSFRVDRTRNVKLTKEAFAPRDGFDPDELGGARAVRVLYLPEIARWKVEKGARPLADGSAVADLAAGSPDWLVSEILADRGYAVVVEPADLREVVAARALELAETAVRDAGPSRARSR